MIRIMFIAILMYEREKKANINCSNSKMKRIVLNNMFLCKTNPLNFVRDFKNLL